MQDRYAGDIGDFGKYGLLRALCGDDLRLGVLWYAFEGDREQAPNDGKRIDYLDPPDERLRECDPDLFDRMRDVVYGGDRSIAALERSGSLPEGARFHGEKLGFEPSERPPDRGKRRQNWLARGLEAIERTDVVFADPDNGLEVPGTGPLAAKGPKYAYFGDLIPCWERGQSLVIYQHATRAGGGMGLQIASRIEELREHFGGGLQPIVLRWRRISARAYFILPNPVHADTLAARIERFLASEWGRREHFTRYVPIPPL